MLFSSITFLGFFLPIVFILYWLVPVRIYKNTLLFFSSLLFYAWGEPKFVFLMLFSIFFNYVAGLKISHTTNEKRRKIVLAFSVFINLTILFIFKYLGFSIKIIDIFLTSIHIKPLNIINMILPIGISFLYIPRNFLPC